MVVAGFSLRPESPNMRIKHCEIPSQPKGCGYHLAKLELMILNSYIPRIPRLLVEFALHPFRHFIFAPRAESYNLKPVPDNFIIT